MSKINYLAFFAGESQVYGSSTKRVVLELPPPEGLTLEDKRIVFITFAPDTKELMVHPLPKEEIMAAQIKEKRSV